MHDDDFAMDYEPSLADEILSRAATELFAAAKDRVVATVNDIKAENSRLKAKNKRLLAQVTEFDKMKAELIGERDRLEKESKRMSIKKFFGQRTVLMYRAEYTKQDRPPKCDKCNDRRERPYKTPLGRDAKEFCECATYRYEWMPGELQLVELRKNRTELLMWFKPDSNNDGYSSGKIIRDKNIFAGQPFANLDKYKVYFNNMDECQQYCDWLNEQKDN